MHAPALIDHATLDFRDMHEVGGLIVRRESSHTKVSARFARSLDELMARIETYRALLNIRDIGAGGLSWTRAWELQVKRSVAIPNQQYFSIVTECKDTVHKWKEMD